MRATRRPSSAQRALWFSFGLVTACHGRASSRPLVNPSVDASEPADLVADGPPTVRLYFLSNLAGALEPCGCVKDQLGGLDHAAAWIRGETARAPTSLLVTAGPTFFMNPALDALHRSGDIAKAEAIAAGLKDLGLAGWVPGENDWAAGAEEVGRLSRLSGATALTANVYPDAGGSRLATRIVDLTAARVALIGVSAADPAAPASTVAPGRIVEDDVRSAAATARKDGANIIVVLGSIGRGEAKRIADSVPDVAAIVVGDVSEGGEANVPAPPEEAIGKVIIAESANHLQALGVIDFYVRGGSYSFEDVLRSGEARSRAELTRRIDELHIRLASWQRDKNIAPADLVARMDDLAKLEAERSRRDARPAPAHGSYFRYSLKEIRGSLGKDPGVSASILRYYRLVNEANRTELQGRLPIPAARDASSYVGTSKCKVCHLPAARFWDKTSHAKAYATLATQEKQYNLDCISCHVTGYEKPGGSTVTHVDGLKDVQCEACHGPSSVHASRPQVKTPVPKPDPELCRTCHHSPHVEDFDARAKMKEILGHGHGR